MTSAKTDLMDSLRNCLGVGQGRGDYVKTPVDPPTTPVKFPVSKDDLTLRYFTDYKAEYKPIMAAWVEQTLTAIDESDEQLARGIVYDVAKKEIGTRGLYHPEYRLLCECTRDFIVGRHAKRESSAGDAR